MPKLRVHRHDVIQPLDQSYRLIPLTQGQNAIVDAADCEWLMQWNWTSGWCEDTQSFYAYRVSGNKTIRMSRLILDCNSKELADHENHDTLDNRRANLRKATKRQNTFNQRKARDNTSGFKGVTWRKGLAVARIRGNGKLLHIGSFLTAEEAARAYDEAAIRYHGEFAFLNFPKR